MSVGSIDVLAQVIQNALKNEACPKFTSKLSANGPFADESSIKKKGLGLADFVMARSL